jgi:hypothetical protein
MTVHNRAIWWLATIAAGLALNKGRRHLARLRPYWVAKYRGHEADLRNAALPQAELAGANLHMANLRTADLQRANLQGASLLRADLFCARLNGANLAETSPVRPTCRERS